MTAKNQNFSLTAGDSRTLRFVCTRPDGTPIDLTGGTARWWAGKHLRARADDVLITKTGTVDSVQIAGVNYWRANIDLVPADTQNLDVRSYSHQCEVTTAEGKVYTVAEGSLFLGPSMGP